MVLPVDEMTLLTLPRHVNKVIFSMASHFAGWVVPRSSSLEATHRSALLARKQNEFATEKMTLLTLKPLLFDKAKRRLWLKMVHQC